MIFIISFKKGKTMKKDYILNKIKQLIYFFTSEHKIKTAIFSKIKFHSSPKYYNYIILKGNLCI